MISRFRFLPSRQNGRTADRQPECILLSARLNFSHGVMSMALARIKSSVLNSVMSHSVAVQRLVSPVALMATLCFGLFHAPLATANVWTQASAEIGAAYNVEAKPTLLIQASAGYERVSASFLASSVRGNPEIVLASLRYSGDGYHIDAGRIGASIGLTPPAYSAVIPSASEPDIYPSINRSILRSVGLPSAGVALTTRGFSVRAYVPTMATQEELTTIATAGSEIKEAGPLTPNICTLCDFAARLTGLDINPVFNPDSSVETIDVEVKSVVQVGYGWSNQNLRLVADVLRAEINDRAVGVGFFGAEFNNRLVSLGGQLGFVAQAKTGSVYILYPGETFKPYARAAVYDGPLRVFEYGAGVSATMGRLSVRGGYEWIGEYDGPTAAISWRL